MIKLTIDEINRYVLPEKINFDNQTEILNKENYINLTKMLKFIENNGNIIKDFYNLKKKEFEDKYNLPFFLHKKRVCKGKNSRIQKEQKKDRLSERGISQAGI